jgi:hypothetical protein
MNLLAISFPFIFPRHRPGPQNKIRGEISIMHIENIIQGAQIVRVAVGGAGGMIGNLANYIPGDVRGTCKPQ